MTDISLLKGVHAGERCLLLANGPSLNSVPPEGWQRVRRAQRGSEPIGVRVIGLNRSHEVFNTPDWHISLDYPHFLPPHNEATRRLSEEGRLITSTVRRTEYGLGIGVRLMGGIARYTPSDPALFRQLRGLPSDAPAAISVSRNFTGWSWDLAEGAFSWRNVGYFALQVAVWMGFTNIFVLGLDCKDSPDGATHFFGRHHKELPAGLDKHGMAKEAFGFAAGILHQYERAQIHLVQAGLLKEARPVRVFNCSPGSALHCFLKVPWQAALS